MTFRIGALVKGSGVVIVMGCAAMCALSVPHARAGGFMQPQGGAYRELEFYHYASERFFDTSRAVIRAGPFTFLEPYRKQEVKAYAEQGLSPNLTLGAELAFAYAELYRFGVPYRDESDVNAAAFFARTGLSQGPFLFSALQAELRYSGGRSAQTRAAFGEQDVALRFVYQRTKKYRPRRLFIPWLWKEVRAERFFEIDSAVEQDIDSSQTRILVEIKEEWRWPGWFLRQQSFERYALNNLATENTPFARDSDLATLGLSMGYEVMPGIYVYAGVRRDVYGRNARAGTGWLIGISRSEAPAPKSAGKTKHP